MEKNRVRVIGVVSMVVMCLVMPVLYVMQMGVAGEIEDLNLQVSELGKFDDWIELVGFGDEFDIDLESEFDVGLELGLNDVQSLLVNGEFDVLLEGSRVRSVELVGEIEKKSVHFNILKYGLSVTFLVFVYLLINLLGKMLIQIITLNGISGYGDIDITTGVYNRSKCSEMLDSTTFITKEKTNCFMVFNLKNLRKINKCDKLVVYELVHSFGNILLQATRSIYPLPFIGRFDDNKFLVYYEQCSGDETVSEYVEEVRKQIYEFNQNHGGYRIEYNYGYAVNSIDEYLCVVELFQKAEAKAIEIENTKTTDRIEKYTKKLPVLEVFPSLENEFKQQKAVRELQIRNLKVLFVIFIIIGVVLLIQKLI